MARAGPDVGFPFRHSMFVLKPGFVGFTFLQGFRRFGCAGTTSLLLVGMHSLVFVWAIQMTVSQTRRRIILEVEVLEWVRMKSLTIPSACRKEPGFGMWVCSSVTVKAMQARVLSMSRELSSRLTCSTVQTLGVRS